MQIWPTLKTILSIILWMIISGLSLWFLLRESAGFLLKLHNLPDNHKMLPLLLKKLIPVAIEKFLPKTFVLLRKEEPLPPDHWVRWLGGPGTLIIDDGLAVYLEQYGRFSRIAGPGLPLTNLMRHETIKDIVDLRRKTIERENIKAWAKDGVEIKYSIKAEIQIAASDEAREKSVLKEQNKREQGEKNLVHAFDPTAVRLAVERTSVAYNHGSKSLEERTWIDATAGTITGRLSAYIAGYSINEMLFQDENSPQLFSFTVSEELFENINNSLLNMGVEFLGLDMVSFAPVDEEISKGLLALWSAEREKQNNIRKGEDDARRIRAVQRAQTISQQEFFDSLIENLTDMDGDVSAVSGFELEAFSETAILLMTQILNKNISNPILKTYLAREMLDTLTVLKEQLEI